MLERYASATRSTNLRNDERHAAINAVVAMGFADIPLGSLAVRAKFADHPQARLQLLAALKARCESRAKARKWPESVDPISVAVATFTYWLYPQCESCTGAKELAYRTCPDCAGSGVRPVQASSAELPHVEDNLAYLNQTVARTQRAMSDRLRTR